MKTVKVNIDGVYFNATHYSSFEKKEACEKMVKDGNAKDLDYAGKCYDECVKAVAESKKKK